ncbi:hypothetical protein GCM10028805_12750 [Spirosoma harenae]
MTFLANTDAIIIDIRKNHGFADGGYLIASYFFTDAVHWSDSYDPYTDATSHQNCS